MTAQTNPTGSATEQGATPRRVNLPTRLRNTTDVVAFLRRRARVLNERMPDEGARAALVPTGHPRLANAANLSAVVLRTLGDPKVSDKVVMSTLIDIRPILEQYASDGEDAGNDSDCVRGCDENLQECIEHWVTVISGDDFSLDPPPDQEQDPGSVGSIDDNPLDVENNDPGQGTGTDDESDQGGHEVPPVIGTEVYAASSALCMIEFVVCNAACLIPG